MKKIIFILFLSSFFTHTSYAVSLKDATLAVQKQELVTYHYLVTYRSAVSKSYFDASNYLSDGRKYLNMKGQEKISISILSKFKGLC